MLPIAKAARNASTKEQPPGTGTIDAGGEAAIVQNDGRVIVVCHADIQKVFRRKFVHPIPSVLQGAA